MTGYLNAHGDYPHIEAGQFVSFPDETWEDDMPVTEDPARDFIPLEELSSDNTVWSWSKSEEDLTSRYWIESKDDLDHPDEVEPDQEDHDQFDMNPRRDHIKAWAEDTYGHLDVFSAGDPLVEDAADELREHQPHHEAVSATTAELRGEFTDHNRARQPHRKGRTHVCNRSKIARRRARRDSHRQMDAIWLEEMEAPTYSLFEHHQAHATAFDYHQEIDELWFALEDERDCLNWYLGTVRHSWQYQAMTEKRNNVTIYEEYDCDDIRNDRMQHHGRTWDEPGYRFNPDSGYFDWDCGYDFWGDEYPEDEGDDDEFNFTYDDPVDRYEFGILTEEDEVYLDAEAAAAEAAAEAFEMDFEHLPAGFGCGRRAQLAARAA